MRARHFILVPLLATPLFIGAAPALASGDSAPWIMNSVNMLPTDGYPFGSQAACEQVRNLKKELNINTLSFRKNLVVSTFDSPNPFDPGHDDTDDKQIEQQFRTDEKLGVKTYFEVGLRVQTDQEAEAKAHQDASADGCGDQRFSPWHGTILFDSPEKYSQFFDKYGAQVLHYADIVKKTGGVSVFSIGHELDSLAGTAPLETKADSDDFANNLNMFMMWMDPTAKKWAQTEVSDLLKFNDALGTNSIPMNTTMSPDNRSTATKAWDWLEEKSDDVKSEFTKSPRQELEAWAKSGGKTCLSSITHPYAHSACLSNGAKAYLAQLENTRRAFLNAKWEKLIDQLHAKFASMPKSKRPLVTYTVGDPQKIGPYAKKLDILSVSPYWSLGNSRGKYPALDNDISVDHLEAGWERAMGWLDEQVREPGPYKGKQVIFSEIGFTPRQHSTQQPSRWRGCQQLVTKWGWLFGNPSVPAMQRPILEQERDDAIQALQDAIQEEDPNSWQDEKKYPWIAGVNIYDTYTHPSNSISDDYCVDCYLKNSCQPEASDYDASVKDLFDSVSPVTNKYAYSAYDACLPHKPKPKPKLNPIYSNLRFEHPIAQAPAPLQDVPAPDIPAAVPAAPAVPFINLQNPSPGNPLGFPAIEQRPAPVPDAPAPDDSDGDQDPLMPGRSM